jgi:predicted dehydrogenase
VDSNKIRVGVIGLGHNGLAWCDGYSKHPECELVAVCDRDAKRTEAAVGHFGVKGFTDYDILEQPLDLVSVHTPDHLHAEPFILSLQAGMHVVVEKPMANDLEDLERMVKAADAGDRLTYVGQVLRWNPLFQFVKRMVDDGTLGDVFYVEGDYNHDLRMQLQMEDWKVSKEKPLVGGGVHPFDLLRWYVGNAVEAFAYSNHKAYPEMREDTTIVSVFEFESGAVGKVTAMYAPIIAGMAHDYNMAVYGRKGSIIRRQMFLDGLAKPMDLPIEYHGHPYDPQIEHMVRCIKEKRQPLVDAHEGANSAAGVLCAHESALLHRPVKVPRF